MAKIAPKRNPANAAAKRQVNRLPPERRIADILLAARDVFTEKGYQDALISDIADRAGVVEGSIYRFFANKRDLLVKTVEHWYEDMLAHDEEQFRGVRGTWNRIRFVVHHHLATIRREPALSRLVFQELRPDPGYRNTRLFKLNQAYTHRIVEIVKAAMASGEFRSDVSPSLVRDMVFGAVEHRTWAFLRNEGEFIVDETADGIADLIYRGLVLRPLEEPTAKFALQVGKRRREARGDDGEGRPRALTEPSDEGGDVQIRSERRSGARDRRRARHRRGVGARAATRGRAMSSSRTGTPPAPLRWRRATAWRPMRSTSRRRTRCRAWWRTIERERGPIAILVNCAGPLQNTEPPEALSMAMWDRIVDAHLRGTYMMNRTVGLRMASRRKGAIVTIASTAGMRSTPLHAYAPAKAALISLTECLAAEWGPRGVRVNAISPGFVPTPGVQRGLSEGLLDAKALADSAALGRLVAPEEIAAAVVFLCSDLASAITGVNLPVDAGWLVASSWAAYGGLRRDSVEG